MGLVKPVWPVLQRGNSLVPGLGAAWPFYEGSGVTLNDLSGKGNNGELNSVSWTAGSFGSAISFAGTTQYILLPVGLANGNSGTFACTFSPTWGSDGVAHVLAGQGDGVDHAFFRVEKFSDNNWYVGFVGGADYRVVVSNATAGVTAGKDFRLVFTWTVGSGSTLYFNGVNVGSHSGLVMPAISAFSFYLGRSDTGTTYYNSGTMSEARLYNRAWSSAEVSNDYFDPFAIYRKPSRWWESVLISGGLSILKGSLSLSQNIITAPLVTSPLPKGTLSLAQRITTGAAKGAVSAPSLLLSPDVLKGSAAGAVAKSVLTLGADTTKGAVSSTVPKATLVLSPDALSGRVTPTLPKASLVLGVDHLSGSGPLTVTITKNTLGLGTSNTGIGPQNGSVPPSYADREVKHTDSKPAWSPTS